jgi:hypothetical protein
VAPPLPYGRPGPPTPIAPARALPPVPTAPPKRAKLAPDQSPPVAPAADDSPDEDEKLRQMRRELADLHEREIEEQEWLDELAGYCKHGRTALRVLGWGLVAYALAVLLQFAAVAAAGFQMLDVAALVGLPCLALAGIGSLLMGVGFGFAIAGPRQSRHIGVMGLVVTILHALAAVLQPGNLAIVAAIQGIDSHGKPMWSDVLVIQDLLGLATNLPLLADHPARFIQGYNWSLPGLIVAALEFTRLVLVCMLIESYATAGKDPETGHRAFKKVSHVSFMVMLMASLRLAAAALFDWAQYGDLLFVIGMTVHGGITGGLYTGLAVALLLLSRTVRDTVDLVDHRRFADKRERLEL